MAGPSGYNMYANGKTYCCKVGNLYGHVIAGKNWYITFDEFVVIRCQMTKSQWDPCFYYRVVDGKSFWLLVYVDDLLMFETKDSGLYDEFAAEFSKTFEWTPFGTDLHDFLSIRIQQSPGKVTLDMEDYITRCTEEAFPAGVHHEYAVPADTDLPQVVAKASRQKDKSHAGTDIDKRFRRIVAQTLYAAIQCRPDCLAAVNYLSRVQAYPSPDLLKRACASPFASRTPRSRPTTATAS